MEEKRCYGCMNIKKQSPNCEHCGHNETTGNQPHQLPCGTVLAGRYTIGKALGQGAVSITYLAWDKKLEAAVAIKEYYPGTMANREGTSVVSQNPSFRKGVNLFMSEAANLAGIRGLPQIVRVHGYFEENGTAYLVMEYLKGTDLQTYIRRKGRLTVQETFTLLRPLMSAVSVMHSDGLVHRSISPDHILLLPNGSAKLLDFSSAATEAGLKAGFSAPEQYGSGKDLGSWTDVYAFCAIIYFCLKGSAPLDARRRVQTGAHIDWSGVPTLNGRQQIALDKGMAIQKKDRLCTMEELSRELFAPAAQISRPKPAPQPQRPVAPAPKPVAPAYRPEPMNRTMPVGNPIQNYQSNTSPVVEEPVTKKKTGRNTAVIIGAILVALVIGFFTIHDWSEPTCDSPAICSICKQEKGEPLGHDWSNPSCTEGKVCRTCGAVASAAPGHEWIPATYDSPKECINCGVTEGNVKGYVGDVKLIDTDEKFWRTGRYTYVHELEKTLESCMRFTLNYQITAVDMGNVYGRHDVYIRLTNGEWRCLDGVQVENQNAHSFEFVLDPTVSFDAVAVVCQTNGTWSFTYSIGLSDVQLKVD